MKHNHPTCEVAVASEPVLVYAIFMMAKTEVVDQLPEQVETAKSRAMKSLEEMLKPLYAEMEANRRRNQTLARLGMQTSSKSESSSE